MGEKTTVSHISEEEMSASTEHEVAIEVPNWYRGRVSRKGRNGDESIG
jgi:hypothetical protein